MGHAEWPEIQSGEENKSGVEKMTIDLPSQDAAVGKSSRSTEKIEIKRGTPESYEDCIERNRCPHPKCKKPVPSQLIGHYAGFCGSRHLEGSKDYFVNDAYSSYHSIKDQTEKAHEELAQKYGERYQEVMRNSSFIDPFTVEEISKYLEGEEQRKEGLGKDNTETSAKREERKEDREDQDVPKSSMAA